MTEERLEDEWFEQEGRLDLAVAASVLRNGATLRKIACPNGDHLVDICIKKIGDLGDAKVQWQCDGCGLGAEGYYPHADCLPYTRIQTPLPPTSLPTSGFYQSQQWREIRYKALSASRGCCECCGRRAAKDGLKLHVDHIKPISRFPELKLELSNLQVLCEDCNLGKRASDCTDWRSR